MYITGIKDLVKKIKVHTQIAHTSRTANTVNVFLNVTGQIKVNNVLHIADVQTSSSHLEE